MESAQSMSKKTNIKQDTKYFDSDQEDFWTSARETPRKEDLGE
jgi:hypothetical protein